jgi:hypothetical protein
MKQMFCTQDQKTLVISILDWDKYCFHCRKQLKLFVDKMSDTMLKFPFFFSLILNNVPHMGLCDV